MKSARIRSVRWPLAALALAAGVLMTGCSSSSATASGGSPTPSSAHGTAGATAPAASPSAAGTVVAIRTGPDGPYLVDGAGAALYLFTLDAGTTSSCTGDCAQAWPPYTTTGALTAGPGASATLAVTTQPGGVKQVTYNGHLLYHFAKEPNPGSISGEGANNVWYLVSPAGDAIKKSS